MNKPGPLACGIMSCFLFAWAGFGVYTGHVRVGKFNPTIVSVNDDPHRFWDIIMLRLVFGVVILCWGIYQFLKNRGS